MIVVGAGSGTAAGGLKLGHFAAMRWQHTHPDTGPDAETGLDAGVGAGPDGGRLPEVFIGGEGLLRGPVGVLGTLLHEAAHALAHVRGIKDTSRQGRWHNARFKALAEELGITVAKDPRIGWSPTTVPGTTTTAYTNTLAGLAGALRLHRAVEIDSTGPAKKAPPPCVCGCGRRIRVAPSVLAAGPITCGICDTTFEPEED